MKLPLEAYLDSPTMPVVNEPKESNLKPAEEGQVENLPEDALTKEVMAVPYDPVEANN